MSKFYGGTRVNISGSMFNPPRQDFGKALKHEILDRRSSRPLKTYMRDRLDSLAKAAGYYDFLDFETKQFYENHDKRLNKKNKK